MFFRYLLVSSLALVLDYSILLGLVRFTHYDPTLSAAFSYIAGALLHYVLSRRFVFSPGWLQTKRRTELAAFMLTSLIGTGITSLIIFINIKYAIIDLFLAKSFAVVVSFTTIFFLRKYFVFSSARKLGYCALRP